jgi:hypothetical protein
MYSMLAAIAKRKMTFGAEEVRVRATGRGRIAVRDDPAVGRGKPAPDPLGALGRPRVP